MSLLNKENANQTSAAFEADDDAAQVAATGSAAQAATASSNASVSPSAEKAQPAEASAQPVKANVDAAIAAVPVVGNDLTSLTVTGETALAMRETRRQLQGYKDALPVDYDTLDQIIASNGVFMDRETKAVLGDTVVFEYLSFQDSWVVSPEVKDAPKELLRYSKDGVVCSDGTMVQTHLDHLKNNGFPDARLKQRVVVVGAVESASKTSAFNGKLVQFDLSPKSRTMWNRFQTQIAYAMAKKTVDKIGRVKAETVVKTAGTDSYTVGTFRAAD